MFEAYDIAWAKYRNGLRIVPVPLISWNFYSMPKSESHDFENIQRNWTAKVDYKKNIKNKIVSVLVTDSTLKIVFASHNIITMNGYNPSEVIGKSPKMFQGIDTSKETRKRISTAIKERLPFKEVILNYNKTGESYWCEIEAYPKFNATGEFVNYIAFERIA